MLGAIFGDIVGSSYEFHNTKNYNFTLLNKYSRPTDDSYMTLAVAKALLSTKNQLDRHVKDAIIDSMHDIGRKYPKAGYGGMFRKWLRTNDRRPYYSFGNGSGMRVSSVGWLYDTLEETLHYAKLSAEVTHNHPEGIKGAQSIAACIFMARHHGSKEHIKKYIEDHFYTLDFTIDEIRPTYKFDVKCQGSCPQAIQAFLESDSYIDCIRKAVSIGGDSDTIACMAGGIAEAYYGLDKEYEDIVYQYFDKDCKDIIKNFIDNSSYKHD